MRSVQIYTNKEESSEKHIKDMYPSAFSKCPVTECRKKL